MRMEVVSSWGSLFETVKRESNHHNRSQPAWRRARQNSTSSANVSRLVPFSATGQIPFVPPGTLDHNHRFGGGVSDVTADQF